MMPHLDIEYGTVGDAKGFLKCEDAHARHSWKPAGNAVELIFTIVEV